MLNEPIKILIADDKKEICDSLEDNLLVELEKFGLHPHDLEIKKAYTEHAYEHGSKAVIDGFKPDICIFDLVFNGYTGVDLYKFIKNHLNGKVIYMCVYTGVEKKFEKRKEAEVLASESGLITIIAKPNISEILEWFEDLLTDKYNLEKKIEERDPFDLL